MHVSRAACWLMLLATTACGADDSSAGSYDRGSDGPYAPGGDAAPSPDAPPGEEVEAEALYEAPVVAGSSIWLANPKSGRVAYVDTVSLAVHTAEAGNGPTQLAAVAGQAGDAVIVLNALSRDATLLVRTGTGVDTRRFPVADHLNRWSVAPTGAVAVAWGDARLLDQPPRTLGLQDLTVIEPASGRSTTLAVGYRPLAVGFDTQGTRAYAVTQDGIALIDLTASPPRVVANWSLGGDPLEDTLTRDVSVTPDARFAFVRRDGSAVVRVVSLADGTITEVTLPAVATDLDLTPDGALAVVVLRETSQVALLPVARIADDPDDVTLIEVTDRRVGSAVLPASSDVALLFTTATPVEALTMLRLDDPTSVRTVRLYAPPFAVFGSPAGRHAVVLHAASSSSPGAFSVVPVADPFPAHRRHRSRAVRGGGRRRVRRGGRARRPEPSVWCLHLDLVELGRAALRTGQPAAGGGAGAQRAPRLHRPGLRRRAHHLHRSRHRIGAYPHRLRAGCPRRGGVAMRRTNAGAACALLASLVLAACGGRDEIWDQPIDATTLGLVDGVAVIDAAAERALLVRPVRADRLDVAAFETGRNLQAAKVSADGVRAFVLSAGAVPRRKSDDPAPSLTVIDARRGSSLRLPLDTPHTGLSLDPEGRYAVVHAAPNEGALGLVENPNELVVVDLSTAEPTVRTRTLRSFGGRPVRLTFTAPLGLPGGVRRLLLVETERDLSLVDLEHPERPEITVRLTSGNDVRTLVPQALVVDDGDPERDDDTRIALRVSGGNDVVLLTLLPSEPGAPNDFVPVVNLAGAGGAVSDVAFVRTDVGLRLAALVPSARKAVLFDPASSLATDVDLGAGYERLSLVGGGSTALLSGTSVAGVAFWAFTSAPDRPYRTVEVLPLGSGVTEILAVPQRPDLRVLTATSSLYVLDLAERTAAPLSLRSSARTLVSADGERLWIHPPSSQELARVEVDNLASRALPLPRAVDEVFDVERLDGGRAVLALRKEGGVGITMLDARDPDATRAHVLDGVLLTEAR